MKEVFACSTSTRSFLHVLNFLVELNQGQVFLRRQVCHHCLTRSLSLWQPPAGPRITSLPAYWRLGLGAPNCNECPNSLVSTCSSVHVLLLLFYVIDCYVIWLCILNEIFVWTQVVNKLLLLLTCGNGLKSSKIFRIYTNQVEHDCNGFDRLLIKYWLCH